MNLVIDIGNTNTKISVFENGKEVSNFRFEEILSSDIHDIYENHPEITHVILSSVKETAILSEIKSQFKNVLELNENTPLPIKLNYDTPETLGKDRIAAAVGASFLYKNKSILVIDAGTALTLDFVHNNTFVGGNISAGLTTRFKALHKFTGKLPLLSLNKEVTLTGKSTNQAIISGVWFGMVYEIQGYINQYKMQYKELITIMTGGDANYFVEKLKSSIFVVFNLNMIGLNRILEYNVNEK